VSYAYGRFSITPEAMLKANSQALTPSTLCIETTTRCNGRCSYCAMSIHRPKAQDMDIDTYRYVIDSVPGRQRVWPVSFGEALLWPHLVDGIHYTSQASKSPCLVTNGTLLTRSMAHDLLLAGLELVRFSVDAADSETYAKLRPGLSWAVLLENVRAFIQERDKLGAHCAVMARATITAANRSQQGRIKQFWTSEGCGVQFKPAIYVPGPSECGYVRGKPLPCKWPLQVLMIKADGSTALCCKDWWGNYPAGSVHDTPPLGLFNGAQFQALRKGMATGKRVPVICTKCTQEAS